MKLFQDYVYAALPVRQVLDVDLSGFSRIPKIHEYFFVNFLGIGSNHYLNFVRYLKILIIS